MQNIPIFRSNNYSSGSTSNRRVDANEMMFFTNELTNYDPKDYEVLKAPLTAFNIFHERPIPKHATIYQYNVFESMGKAKYAAVKSGKADDAPFINAGGTQFASPVADLLCAIAFSDGDILAGQAVQRDIMGMLLTQAMRANMELMNTTCFKGNKELGLQGILSNQNIVKITAASDLALAATGGDALLKELSKIYSSTIDASKGLILPDTMLVSPAIFTNLNLTIGNSFSGVNVKSIFESMMNVKVISAPELAKGAYENTKQMAILFKNSPEFIEHVVAELFAVKPPQPQGLEYISYCYSRHGGIVIRQPKAICLITNIT